MGLNDLYRRARYVYTNSRDVKNTLNNSFSKAGSQYNSGNYLQALQSALGGVSNAWDMNVEASKRLNNDYLQPYGLSVDSLPALALSGWSAPVSYSLGTHVKGVTTDGTPYGLMYGSSDADAYKNYIDYFNNSQSADSYWNSLSDAEKRDYLNTYMTQGGEVKDYRTLFGLLPGKSYEMPLDAILKDLEALNKWGLPPDLVAPVYGDYVQSSEDIYKGVDSELAKIYDAANARLDEEQAFMRQDFTDQLNSNAAMYNRQASNLMSNQYLANAQTYDALQSDMRKSRQNALEAGASAGIRLAGNVNALLSAQNKQSQTALDTSNALADMLLQQRNAAAGIRSDYRNYMSDYNQRRTDLDRQRSSDRTNMYNQRFNEQNADYERARRDYDDKMSAWKTEGSRISDTNNMKSGYEVWATKNKK